MTIKFKKYWRKTSLKQKGIGDLFLKHIKENKPKNFLEIGIFHGVTARNVCNLLYSIHGEDFKYTGIDPFLNDAKVSEHVPKTNFLNPLKKIYYNYIVRLNPYSFESVQKLLKKFSNNINIIQDFSYNILKDINVGVFDYVFIDGGHKYETVKSDLESLLDVINNNGIILCDDYDLTYASGVKRAIDEYVNKNKFSLRILHSRFAEIKK